MQLITALAVVLLSGAKSLAAPQTHGLYERQEGASLVIQKFPDSNCEQSLEENKFSLEVVEDQCIGDITNANSIKMIEQPSKTKICTYSTWSGTNCEGSTSRPRAGDLCQPGLAFASFNVTCVNIPG